MASSGAMTISQTIKVNFSRNEEEKLLFNNDIFYRFFKNES